MGNKDPIPTNRHGTLLLRLLMSTTKTNHCWIWIGGYFNDGYGSIWYEGKNIRVNRASWMIYKGVIPEGMEVCHTCDNTKCINPDHLFIGSRLDNEQDKKAKGRTPMGSKNGSSKLTRSDVIKIKGAIIANESHLEIAKRFKVHPSTISLIRTGKRWGSVW